MVEFNSVIKIQRTSCKKCFSLIYSLPCRVDKEIVSYFKTFGKPMYPLGAIKLLRINSSDGYKIESRLEQNSITFALPKHLENTDISTNSRKIEFETGLSEWMSKKLSIPITLT